MIDRIFKPVLACDICNTEVPLEYVRQYPLPAVPGLCLNLCPECNDLKEHIITDAYGSACLGGPACVI